MEGSSVLCPLFVQAVEAVTPVFTSSGSNGLQFGLSIGTTQTDGVHLRVYDPAHTTEAFNRKVTYQTS